MKTQLETVSSIKKKITVDVPVERVAKALESIYQEIQKTAEIKGFRKGHAPREMIERYYKDDAEKEAVKEIVRASYPEALKEQTISPISDPQITAGPFDKDKPFTYTAEFEVRPELGTIEYHELPLERLVRDIEDSEVLKALHSTRQQMTQLEPAPDDTAVEKGLVAYIDFKGTADGKPFKGGEAENFMVDVGGGQLLGDFESRIFGMKKGESREIEFDYPADYFNKELAGKKGRFSVTVRELKVKMVPELNDEFAKDLGNYKNLDEVRAEIKKRLEATAEHEARVALANQAMDVLVKKHQFEVPESMIASELKFLFDTFVRQLSAQGKKFEDSGMTVEQFIEKFRPTATDRVRGYLILDAIAKRENVSVAESDIEARLQAISAQTGQPLPRVRDYYEKNNLIGGLRLQVLHEKTLDFIVLKAKIKVKKVKKEKKG